MIHTTFFEPEHHTLAEKLDRFARSEVEPRSGEEADDTAQALDFIQPLARGGWLRYVVPQSFGGVHPHLDLRSVCLIRRGLARYSSLADTMFAMQGLGSYPITLAGSEKIKQRFLPQVASGEAIATFALTEPEAGSDAAGIQTRARREGNEYVLEGTKKFISNAGIAAFYVVFAKTDPSQGRKGISAIVVEKDRPGFKMTRKLELIAPHPIGEFQLERCRVPAENLLGMEGEGYSILLQTLESFRTTVGAGGEGARGGYGVCQKKEAVRKNAFRVPRTPLHAGRDGYGAGSGPAAGLSGSVEPGPGSPGSCVRLCLILNRGWPNLASDIGSGLFDGQALLHRNRTEGDRPGAANPRRHGRAERNRGRAALPGNPRPARL